MNTLNKLAKGILLTALICFLSACAGPRPNTFIPKNQPPGKKLAKRPNVALVLGSGGARGYAHLGVLQVLQDAGVPINMIVGASAGSFVSALYADNRSAAKTYQIMMHAGFWNLADISNLPSLRGLIEGYHMQKYLLKNTKGHTFKKLKLKLAVATTDILTGKTYMIDGGPVPPAVVASAAVPGAVQPQHLYGRILIDGGVADPVPVNIAQRFHPKVIIAVNIGEQLTHKVPLTAYGIYDRAYNIMWNQLTRFSEQNATVIIRPLVGHVSTFDMGYKYQMYLDGVKAAQKALPAIRRALRRNHIALKPRHKFKVYAPVG